MYGIKRKANNELTLFKMIDAEQKKNRSKNVKYIKSFSGRPIIYIIDGITSYLRVAICWLKIWRAWYLHLLCWYICRILVFRFKWCTVNRMCCNVLQNFLTTSGGLRTTIIRRYRLSNEQNELTSTHTNKFTLNGVVFLSQNKLHRALLYACWFLKSIFVQWTFHVCKK